MRKLLIVLFVLLSNSILSQDLMSERIRRVENRKKSVFLNKGIFHNGGPKVPSKIKAIRHNYAARLGYERLVFDFETNEVPRVYGHIDGSNKKVYLDLFETTLGGSIGSFGNSKYVDSVNFFPISKDTLSVEIKFKESISVDIFYLESPGRFVIDIKG